MNKKDINNKIEIVIRCLMAHPDNEPNSEFADRIDDLIDINQAINVIQCCKSDSEQLFAVLRYAMPDQFTDIALKNIVKGFEEQSK